MAPTAESRLNVEALSKNDVLMLFSVLEGELEARDFVIQALKAQRRETFMWERYGKYSLSDPFLALQRDGEVVQTPGVGGEKPDGMCLDPLAVLRLVVGHCRRMQEKMLKQLAASESRHRRVIADLEEEKRKHAEDTAEGDDVTYILEKERERLLQQLEFEKAKACRTEREKKRLQEQNEEQRLQYKQLMTALSRECKRSGSRAHEESQRAGDLSLKLDRQRAANQSLRAELEEEKKRAMRMEARREEQLAEFDTEREQLSLKLRKEEARGRALQEEMERVRREMDIHHAEMNGHHALEPTPDTPSLQAAYQAGIHQRFHAARHKFQGTGDQDPNAARDPASSPGSAPPDVCKQAARSTLTRFKPGSPSSSSPFGTDYRALAHSGMLSPTISSPTIPRAERGQPPPIPPKKPGLAETPPSPVTLRAAAACGRSSNGESSSEPDLVLSSSG